MFITVNTIITAAGVVTAVGVLLGVLFKVHKWYLGQNAQSEEIENLKEQHKDDVKHLKDENRLVCFALSACLDGLQQLGANHTVPLAKAELDKFLNKQAHE